MGQVGEGFAGADQGGGGPGGLDAHLDIVGHQLAGLAQEGQGRFHAFLAAVDDAQVAHGARVAGILAQDQDVFGLGFVELAGLAVTVALAQVMIDLALPGTARAGQEPGRQHQKRPRFHTHVRNAIVAAPA